MNPGHTPSALPRNVVLEGDAGSVIRTLPTSSVDMVLTSPPYFRLRDYGVPGQLGAEPHVDEWVGRLHQVTREVHRILTPSGSLWLNLGDSYATHPRQGAARKSLLLGPERLARALVADGWHLRNKLIWHKTNPVPTSVRDRLASTWEVIYLLTPNPSYHFDLDSLRIPHRSRPPRPRPAPKRLPKDYGHESWRGSNADSTTGLDRLKQLGRSGHLLGKNPGDVWPIATSRTGRGHHATYPVALAERAILAGCPEARCTACRLPWRRGMLRATDGSATRMSLGPTCDCAAPQEPGLVLDPFMGTGTTAVAAERHGRDWLGIELNPDFVRIAGKRITRARAEHPSSARGSPAA